MKLSEIIRNTGLDVAQYPNCSKIHIHLYDGKDRVSSEETINFVEPLLKDNEGSFKNFNYFLSGLEQEDIKSMNVKVDIDTVVLFYKSPRAIVFMRHNSMDPMDYME